MLELFVRLQSTVDKIPEEVLERLPEDVRRQLEDGVIDKIPEDIIDKLPEGLRDSIPPGLIDAATANPLFAVIGVLALAGFGYGVAKSAVKAAVFFAALAAIAWFLFLK
jgi:predicted phage tail protein